jgi:hypothetical protein
MILIRVHSPPFNRTSTGTGTGQWPLAFWNLCSRTGTYRCMMRYSYRYWLLMTACVNDSAAIGDYNIEIIRYYFSPDHRNFRYLSIWIGLVT